MVVLPIKAQIKKKVDISLREIKKEEVKLLESRQIIKNSNKGFVDRAGNLVGFCKTKNKRYIEDKYVNLLEKIKKNKKSNSDTKNFNVHHKNNRTKIR